MLFCSCTDDDYQYLTDLSERKAAGGATTIYTANSTSYSIPAPNLNSQALALHLLGDLDFEAVFVTAPSIVNSGLGPIFNNSSCISCHPRDGRAKFPSDINSRSGLLLRISKSGITSTGSPYPVSGFGTQIQHHAIFGYQPEAKIQVSYTPIIETFADGTQIVLQKPIYTLIEPYTELPSNIMISPRLGTPIFGLGLLECISESDILANQDVEDSDGDGISGRANYVYDNISASYKLGRFGWKANTATIIEQCAMAYLEDMGITSPYFAQETGQGQSNGTDGLDDDPEIDLQTLEQVAFYCKTLGVPASRNHDWYNVKMGAKLFEEIGCAKCHIPKQQTGYSPIEALSNQTIYPYTDLLLHDMGENLADNRPDFLANGREWKTRPLWGIGLTYVVNGHTHFMHDGRAKNLTEAILWHGGEAESSKNNFKSLDAQNRQYLLDFLNSL